MNKWVVHHPTHPPASCLPRRRIICEKRVRRSSRSISSRRPSHGECYGFCADLRGRGLESAGMNIYRWSIVYKFWRYVCCGWPRHVSFQQLLVHLLPSPTPSSSDSIVSYFPHCSAVDVVFVVFSSSWGVRLQSLDKVGIKWSGKSLKATSDNIP